MRARLRSQEKDSSIQLVQVHLKNQIEITPDKIKMIEITEENQGDQIQKILQGTIRVKILSEIG